MWQFLREVLHSPNATVAFFFILIVIVVAAFLSKSGLLTVKTEKIQLGAADREREILRQQIEWIRLHCEALESEMKKPENYNAWRGKYIVSRVYDEYVDWITFNHLSTSSSYIEIKQDRIVNMVSKLTDDPLFHSDEFEEFLRRDVKNCIEKLIQIRTIYK